MRPRHDVRRRSPVARLCGPTAACPQRTQSTPIQDAVLERGTPTLGVVIQHIYVAQIPVRRMAGTLEQGAAELVGRGEIASRRHPDEEDRGQRCGRRLHEDHDELVLDGQER